MVRTSGTSKWKILFIQLYFMFIYNLHFFFDIFIGLPPARWLFTYEEETRWRNRANESIDKTRGTRRQEYRSSCKDLGLRYSGKIAVTGEWANESQRSISILRDYPSSHLLRYFPTESNRSTLHFFLGDM